MVNKDWQLVEQHGCWWAYEGELPPPEAFTTHGRAQVTYSAPFPLAQWQRNSSRDSCLASKAASPPNAPVQPDARNGDDGRMASADPQARAHRRQPGRL